MELIGYTMGMRKKALRMPPISIIRITGRYHHSFTEKQTRRKGMR
jgi:hypothetical protein